MGSPSNIVPEVMTAKEVASYLKINISTVTRLAKRGDLPGKKVGYLWRFQRTVIDRWFGVSSPAEDESQ